MARVCPPPPCAVGRMWVPRAAANAGDDEPCCRARGSHRVVVEADGAVIRLVTRCTSAEEFIERFARYTTTTDIVVPALPHVSAGTGGHFVICLKDRTVMLQGRCEVTEIQPVAVAPGAATTSSLAALMHLRLREMDAHSCGIHLRLMERRALSPRPPAVLEAVPTAVPALDISAVTVVRDGRPPSDTEPTAISPAPRPEERVPGAAFTLPANPLSDLDAADLASFVEETLLESKGAVDAPPIDNGAIADGGAQADPDPERVIPSGRRPRAHPRPDRARRIIRHLWPYAWCVVGGLLVGFAFRPDSKAAPVVAAAIVVPPPEVAPPSHGAGARQRSGPGAAGLRRARDDEAGGCDRVLGRHRAGIEPDRTRGDSLWHRDGDAAARPVRGGDADDRDRARAKRGRRRAIGPAVRQRRDHVLSAPRGHQAEQASCRIGAAHDQRVRSSSAFASTLRCRAISPGRKRSTSRRRSRRSTSGSSVVRRRARDRRRLRRPRPRAPRRQPAQRPRWPRAD